MPARFVTLAKLANGFQWKRGAELGVSDGRTHLFLLENCPQLELIGVDVWDLAGIKLGPTASNERCRCIYCAETKAGRRSSTVQERERLVRAGSVRWGRSTIYKMTTVDAAKKVEYASLDFVFVDADHSMEGVRDDIAAWRPKLKSTGWMIGHDFNMSSVRAGIYMHYDQTEVCQEDDHIWFVRGIC